MKVNLLIVLILVFAACENTPKDNAAPAVYDGPIRTLENVEILHSDSAIIKARVKAPVILMLQNEDREVTKGMFIEFLDPDGTVTATLKSDYAYYFKEEDRWRAEGNVVVDNIANEETLRTEELYWEPKTGDVYTEKFVKIESPGEVITGTGLKAKQDFSTWTLDHPEGVFIIEDEEGANG
jgi:LPS export ABC transporter protein LptC